MADSGKDDTLPAPDATVDETLPAPVGHAPELPIVEAASYELGKELGRGGMGRVLVAKDRRLQRVLAIKVSRSVDASSRARFAREALLTARLQHPSIVPVHEAGTWASGEPFYAMKMVSGRSLEQMIAEARDLDERLALIPNVIAVVDALAYAHSQGIIHRDLKPNNVIGGEFGETIVIDWGLAKELASDDEARVWQRSSGEGETIEGAAVGTPSYMSPEQAAGERVDKRADVYGLGAMLYHVLCGKAPYHQGTSAVDIMDRVKAGPPTPLAERQAGIPPDLLAIVDKAMARDPAERYRDASALAEDLKRFYRGQLVAAHVYSRWQLVRRWLRKHRAVVSVAALALVVIAAGTVLSVRRIIDAKNGAIRNATALLVERGRVELAASRPSRAAILLTQAIADGDRRAATQVMLGAAAPSLDALLARYDAGGPVTAVAIVGDRLVAVGTHASRIWDLRTGSVVQLDVNAAQGDLAISPDGKRAVTASVDGTARIWDLSTGALTRVLAGEHAGEVRHARWLPDGRIVTMGANDGLVRIWNVDGTVIGRLDVGDAFAKLHEDGLMWFLGFDGKPFERRREEGHLLDVELARQRAGGPGYLAVLPNGNIVAALERGEVVVASSDGKPLGMIPVPESRLIHSVVTSGDGRVAIGGTGYGALASAYWQRTTDGFQRIALAPDGDLVTATDDRVVTAAFSPSSNLLAFNDGPTVKVVETHWGTPVRVMPVHEGRVSMLAFADDQHLISVGADHRAVISDPLAGPIWILDAHPERLGTLAVGGGRLAVAGRDGFVYVWDLAASPLRVRLPAIDAHLQDATHWMIVAGAVRTESRSFGEVVRAACYTRDGFATTHVDGSARLWRADGTLAATLATSDTPMEHLACFDGRIVGFAKGAMTLWDMRGPIIARLPDTVAAHTATRFVTVGENTAVWDAANGKRLAIFDEHGTVAALSPDGTKLATADTAVRIWNVADRSLVATLEGHEAPVTDIAFHGTRVVASSQDGTALVWDKGRDPIATLSGHRGIVKVARFSPDGSLVATGGADGTVRIWDPTDGRELLRFEAGGEVIDIELVDDAVFARTNDTASIWAIPKRTSAAIDHAPWRFENGTFVRRAR